MQLTTERLRELLVYSQKTGLFTWRVSRGAAYVAAKRALHEGCTL